MIAAFEGLHGISLPAPLRSLYVAAPYEDAEKVRRVHRFVSLCGIKPTSTWADTAFGPEDLTEPGQAIKMSELAESNDRAVEQADALLLLARDGAGGECFAETRYAHSLGKPILWVGRLTLSAFRRGVLVFLDLDTAIEAIASVACGREKSA